MNPSGLRPHADKASSALPVVSADYPYNSFLASEAQD